MREILHMPEGQEGYLFLLQNERRTRRMHAHDELECNLILRGTARYLLGNGWYELRAHSMVWLFPDQEHVLVDDSADFAMWGLVFTPQLVQRLCADSSAAMLRERNPEGRFCRQLTVPAARHLEMLYHDVMEAGAPTPLVNAGLGYALLQTWHLFQNADPLHCSAPAHPAIEQTIRLIRSGNCAKLGQAELASKVGLSNSRLSRLFKQQTGIPLCEFRNQERVARFLDIQASQPKLCLLDAARRAGFTSYPTFHRVFNRLMGEPPGRHGRTGGKCDG